MKPLKLPEIVDFLLHPRKSCNNFAAQNAYHDSNYTSARILRYSTLDG